MFLFDSTLEEKIKKSFIASSIYIDLSEHCCKLAPIAEDLVGRDLNLNQSLNAKTINQRFLKISNKASNLY